MQINRGKQQNGKTRDLLKKIRDTKGTFHAKTGSIKDRNGLDLTEAEDIKKRWQEYTEELYKTDLYDPDNHDDVITHLKPDILQYEVKWAFSSIQFSSVPQSCLTLCDSVNCTTPGLPVHHLLLESTQTHVHRVDDVIQPSHLSSPSPAFNLSQHQGFFQRVSSLHQVAKVFGASASASVLPINTQD